MSVTPSPTRTEFKVGSPELPGDVHFTLWHIAREQGLLVKNAPSAQLVEFPGGTGEVVRALAGGTVDIGMGLTEGLVAGIAKGADFKIVATTVETPLRWVVLVAADAPYRTIEDLHTKSFGISKPGGGAHLNTLAMTNQKAWIEGLDFQITVLGELNRLIEGLRSGVIDAFLWESLAVKHLLDREEFRQVGNVVPAWPSFMLAAKTELLNGCPGAVKNILNTLLEAAQIFRSQRSYALDLVVKRYRLSTEDASRWYSSVKYSEDGKISRQALEATMEALVVAGVIPQRVTVADLHRTEFAPAVL